MMKHFFILFFLLISSAYATTQDLYSFHTETQAKQFARLTSEIRCVVCQNQSIADSNAPLAKDLRGKVYLMVNEKKSDAEIKNYLTERYSEFILLKPKLNKFTVVLWIFPLLALSSVFIFLFFLARKKMNLISR